MAINNNYGFKTLGKGRQVVINGKWPIFGFDVDRVAQSFRTTRVVDTTVHNYYNSGNTLPSTSSLNPAGFGVNERSGVVRELVTKYEHGYDYRPMGYWTVSGTMNLQGQTTMSQTASGSESSWSGGTYPSPVERTYRLGQYNQELPLTPEIGKISLPTITTSGNLRNLYWLSATIGSNNSCDLVIPSGNPLYGTYYLEYADPGNNQLGAWIDVEVDEKYVYVYMNYAWWDKWYRYAFRNNYGNIDTSVFDIQWRVRSVAQTTGSVFDVNVYLTPYKIEEMIVNG